MPRATAVIARNNLWAPLYETCFEFCALDLQVELELNKLMVLVVHQVEKVVVGKAVNV
jgi:hypothetical protein